MTGIFVGINNVNAANCFFGHITAIRINIFTFLARKLKQKLHESNKSVQGLLKLSMVREKYKYFKFEHLDF